jgi:hypothetical protein
VKYSFGQGKYLLAKMTLAPDVEGIDDDHYISPLQILPLKM